MYSLCNWALRIFEDQYIFLLMKKRANGVLGRQGSPIYVVNLDGCEISEVTDVERVVFDSCMAVNAKTKLGGHAALVLKYLA